MSFGYWCILLSYSNLLNSLQFNQPKDDRWQTTHAIHMQVYFLLHLLLSNLAWNLWKLVTQSACYGQIVTSRIPRTIIGTPKATIRGQQHWNCQQIFLWLLPLWELLFRTWPAWRYIYLSICVEWILWCFGVISNIVFLPYYGEFYREFRNQNNQDILSTWLGVFSLSRMPERIQSLPGKTRDFSAVWMLTAHVTSTIVVSS